MTTGVGLCVGRRKERRNASGGRQGWDDANLGRKQGRHPIDQIGVPQVLNEKNCPRSVELVSWNDGVDENRFGFWLSTRKSFIACAVGGAGRKI